MTLADDDTNSILTDNANRAIQGNVFFFFIGQMGLGTHTLSSTQKSFNFTVETRLQINITFQVLLGGLKKIDT